MVLPAVDGGIPQRGGAIGTRSVLEIDGNRAGASCSIGSHPTNGLEARAGFPAAECVGGHIDPLDLRCRRRIHVRGHVVGRDPGRFVDHGGYVEAGGGS
jgi:hypothetical protein